MSAINDLQTQAVAAAKKGDWKNALAFNQEILENHPDNIGALNRAGFACMQLHEDKQATKYFKQLVALPKTEE